MPFLFLGFRKGINQAETMTGKVREEDIFTNGAKKFIELYSFEKSGLITGYTKELLKEELDKALREGQSPAAFSKTIRDFYDGMEKPRSIATARTEMTGAVNDGLYSTLKHEGHREKEWSTVTDGRERESHAAANGQIVPIDMPFQLQGGSCMYPGDPNLPAAENINCFLPGTTIRGRVNVAIKSFYSGEAIEIITSLGNVLRVTKNHPILSKQGFVPAHSLKQGDELLSYVGDEDITTLSRSSVPPTDEDDAPATVEEVFSTIASLGSCKILRAMPDYFHGDGKCVEGDIEIVWADRKLLDGGEARGLDQSGDLILKGELSQLLSKNGESPLTSFSVGMGPASASLPSSGTLSSDSSGVLLEPTPFQEFSFGASSRGNASFFENTLDRTSRCPDLFSNLLNGEPRLVQADRIVSLRSYETSTHVYDVQSPNGWTVASNIVTSNCRCSMVIPNLGEDRKRLLYDRFLRLHGGLERRLVVSLRRNFRDQRDRILSQFPS